MKDLQKELQNQQGSIDSTRESLNTLCRKYPSEELAGLGSALTDLIKTYESVNQLSAKTLVSLQNCLQQQFNGEILGKKSLVEMCNFYLELSLNVVINSLFSPASSDLVQEFHRWLSEQREIVKECSDRSGDTQIVERKLQKLKVKLKRWNH